jgi:hypothetical protein
MLKSLVKGDSGKLRPGNARRIFSFRLKPSLLIINPFFQFRQFDVENMLKIYRRKIRRLEFFSGTGEKFQTGRNAGL